MRKPPRPDQPPESTEEPGPGGRALDRLRQFEQQRGLPPRKTPAGSAPSKPASKRKKR